MGHRIAIMGGSFNPIHIGHASIAKYVLDHNLADQLWLMVSPQNPLKLNSTFAPDEHRLRMTQMVADHLPGAITSAFEFTLPRPSYTIDTLRALQAKFPDDELSLVIGADNWAVWDKWKEHEALVEEFSVLVYPRLGYDITIGPRLRHRVKAIDAPIIEVSSTAIRQMISDGISPTFYLTPEVEQFILRNKLYT